VRHQRSTLGQVAGFVVLYSEIAGANSILHSARMICRRTA
jgi:hypothetical protein